MSRRSSSLTWARGRGAPVTGTSSRRLDELIDIGLLEADDGRTCRRKLTLVHESIKRSQGDTEACRGILGVELLAAGLPALVGDAGDRGVLVDPHPGLPGRPGAAPRPAGPGRRWRSRPCPTGLPGRSASSPARTASVPSSATSAPSARALLSTASARASACQARVATASSPLMEITLDAVPGGPSCRSRPGWPGPAGAAWASRRGTGPACWPGRGSGWPEQNPPLRPDPAQAILRPSKSTTSRPGSASLASSAVHRPV